ncbi:MAG TPA: alpha/beta fold hydrolase [Solirubrobacteraceae bacterium]|nr:alpha/beta fold hydrolase [Solirubrobacteraceae bacterium]
MTTFVLVAGAWQGGWTWGRVTPLLRARGHEVYTPTLTGLGDRVHLLSPQIGLDTHIEDVVATVRNERLDDVVLVGHSYGGQVIAGAACRLAPAVKRLVYLDAFVPEHGESATEQQPQTIAHHYRESVQERGFGWLIPTRNLEVLGVTDPVDVEWLSALMVPHPYKAFNDPVRLTPQSLSIPSTFIECVDWMRVFRNARERAQARGWPVYELHTGHQAMTTAPHELAELLDQIAKES